MTFGKNGLRCRCPYRKGNDCDYPTCLARAQAHQFPVPSSLPPNVGLINAPIGFWGAWDALIASKSLEPAEGLGL